MQINKDLLHFRSAQECYERNLLMKMLGNSFLAFLASRDEGLGMLDNFGLTSNFTSYQKVHGVNEDIKKIKG